MEIKQKILNELDGKTAKTRYVECLEAREKLMDCIGELRNFGRGCDCECNEICKIIHEGDTDEIMIFCLECGGYIIENEWN